MSRSLVPALCLAIAFGLFDAQHAAAAAADVQAQASVSVSTKSEYTLIRGTTDYEKARQWLQGALGSSDSRFGAASNADAASTGDVIHVSVVHISTQSGKTLTTPIAPAPPWTPGIDGGTKKGDTATITTCGGGWSQEWDLTVAADPVTGALSWVVTGYKAERKQFCSGQ